MSIAVVVPTRNEAATIGPLVTALHLLPVRDLKVLVVDNWSTDGTARIAEDAGARVIVPREPLPGLAACLRLGMTEALTGDVSRVVTIDAGGSHDPNQLIRLLSARGGIVVGARYLPESRYIGRPWRKWGSAVAARLCNARTGARLCDWTSGYRSYSWMVALDLLDRWPALPRMHGIQMALLGQALTTGVTVTQVPITYVAGESSFRLSTVWEVARVWTRLRRVRRGVRQWAT